MAIKYIPYYPDTLEGQAILDNFVRTRRVLRYNGSDGVVEKIKRGMPLFETESKELAGDNPGQNLIIRGECLSACAYLKEKGIAVDLVYIDPPFASGADYAKKIYLRRNPDKAQQLSDAEQQLDIDEVRSFEEKMYGDIWDKERYLNWMYENLTAIKSVMSENASIYVHLDYHIGHYVKILMDEIFGEDNFRNEIIWQRVYSHNDADRYGQIHDVIFYYTNRPDNYIWHGQYTPYDEKYLKMYSMDDGDGRKYKVENTMGPGGRGSTYEWNGVTRTWRYSIETMKKLDSEGLLYYTSSGFPKKKVYLDEMPGKPLQTIWTDINVIAGQADERVDYATQKPEALLERIIKASSDEGMVVADFFGGSGVTAAVANRLGRKFIHGDIGINSIQTVRDRLKAQNAEFEILEISDGVSLYRNPVQTQEKLFSLIKGLHKNEALDSRFWAGSISDSRLGEIPVYLPNLLDSSTRVLDKPQAHRIVLEGISNLGDQFKKVYIYFIDIDGFNEINKFIKEQNKFTLIEHQLMDLKQVLDEVVLEDEANFSVDEFETQDLFKVKMYRTIINSFHSDRIKMKIDTLNSRGEQQALASGKPFKPLTLSDNGLETVEFISVDCENADKKAPWHSDAEIKIDPSGYVIKDGKKTSDYWDGSIVSTRPPLRLKIRNICGDESVYLVVK